MHDIGPHWSYCSTLVTYCYTFTTALSEDQKIRYG
uniref:Uncharacterized protein n=1 Tax=Anguilla anguilla TaxID=7936 RepID=A0A0E9TSU4_ANGAN